MAIRYTRKEVIGRLQKEIDAGQPLFMPNTGMGLSAKIQEKGGADLICISCTSRWRLKGQGSLAGFLPYSDCNELVFEVAREVVPGVKEAPVLTLSGPHNQLLEHGAHLRQLWDMGVSGINPMPSGIFGAEFAAQMEQIGMGFTRELEFITAARERDMFTFAFAFNAEDAELLTRAGADAISSHLGATKGGEIGAAAQMTLEQAASLSQEMFDAARLVNKDVILFAHGGPLETPEDARYVMQHSDAHGFMGGSAAERMPIEKAILDATQDFKGAL